MSESLLGMYVHMHWAYNYPYAARTWSLKDWRSYLTGLRRLGYNLLQLWPMIDTMPASLTPSDRAHLEKLREVIDIAHSLALTVYVGASANTMGNAEAARYTFESRPYFTAENRINPRDQDKIAALMAARRIFIEPLARADGFWIIDSDPGGYPESSPLEFAQLLQLHRALLDTLRPGIALFYWMWQGWTDDFVYSPDWTNTPQPCWRETLAHLKEMNLEPWGIMACWKGHFAAVAECGLANKALYFPYGAIESEPSFPLTNWDPHRLQDVLSIVSPDQHPVGVMGNAQTHCLQLPHTYLFQHLARGGTVETANLEDFAEKVLPGHGADLSRGWMALGNYDQEELGNAFAALQETPTESVLAQGACAALCFNQVGRLVDDLKMQMELKSTILALRNCLTKKEPLADVLPHLEAWAKRHGFVDRYLGTFKDLLHPLLEAVASSTEHGLMLAEALEDFERGNPHGAFEHLLHNLERMTSR